MEALISYVQNEFIEKKDFPEFSSGDTLTVYYQIRERGIKYVLNFLKEQLSRLKVKDYRKHLQLEKCLELLELKESFQ